MHIRVIRDGDPIDVPLDDYLEESYRICCDAGCVIEACCPSYGRLILSIRDGSGIIESYHLRKDGKSWKSDIEGALIGLIETAADQLLEEQETSDGKSGTAGLERNPHPSKWPVWRTVC